MNPDFLEIIRYATKALSGHNTQPWRFNLTENLLIATTHFGYQAHIIRCDTAGIIVELTKDIINSIKRNMAKNY